MTIRYRKLDANGDYLFGQPPATQEFYVDQQEAVAQAIYTRLSLATGDWFLNSDEGTPYKTEVLGYIPPNVRDFALRARILDTIGVNAITVYNSSIDSDRKCTVDGSADTIYGAAAISTII